MSGFAVLRPVLQLGPHSRDAVIGYATLRLSGDTTVRKCSWQGILRGSKCERGSSYSLIHFPRTFYCKILRSSRSCAYGRRPWTKVIRRAEGEQPIWRFKKGMCNMCRSIANLKSIGQWRFVVKRKYSRVAAAEEGQALVEAALVLPMLLTVGTGILIFGIFMMQILSLTEGVGSAGRVLAVSGGVTLDPCASAATAVQNAAPLLKTSNLSYTVTMNTGTGGDQVYSGTSCSSASTTTGAAGYLVSGGTVKVKATYSNCSLSFYGNNLFPGGCSISQTVMETVQ